MTDPILCLTGPDTGRPARPQMSVDKFDQSGHVRQTFGLTLLCHIDPSSDAWAALCELQDQMAKGPHADSFSFLPKPSFHMTVFDGVIDYRRDAANWPGDISVTAPIPDVEAHWRPKVDALDLPKGFTITAMDFLGGFTLNVAETPQLRATRNQIATALDVWRPDHDTYPFHITLGYLIHWLTPEAAQTTQARAQDAFAAQAHRLKDIALGPPEFCRFASMHRFDPIT